MNLRLLLLMNVRQSVFETTLRNARGVEIFAPSRELRLMHGVSLKSHV